MNLLSLVQTLALECGVSGTLTTTAGLVGSQARLLSWVNSAWLELQNEHDDWDFLRSSNALGLGASFATVAGQASYPLGTGVGTCGVPVASFGKWVRDTFRNYTTSVGVSSEMFMEEIPYDAWRDDYYLGANRTVQTRPASFAIGPDKSICLGPPPNALYTITADYFIAPTQMVADTDVPTGLNPRSHRAIVYKAMEMYAGYESAPEVFQRGSAGYRKMLAELEAMNVPELYFAGALI